MYSDLGLLKKLLWIQYRLYSSVGSGTLNYDSLVVERNLNFLLLKELAATAAACWFAFFFPFNLVVRIIAGGLYDADFEDIDERGLKYSLSQATSYHYWEGKESHSLFKMFWVNFVTDFWKIVFGIIPLLFAGPVFLIAYVIYILAYIPIILPITLITPWDEKEHETPLMWWVNAIELGLFDPRDPPSNMFEIEDARTQYLAGFPKLDDEEEEED